MIDGEGKLIGVLQNVYFASVARNSQHIGCQDKIVEEVLSHTDMQL